MERGTFRSITAHWAMYMDAVFGITGAGTKQMQPPVVVTTHWNVLSVSADVKTFHITLLIRHVYSAASLMFYEGWNFNSGNYLFTTDTK